MQILSNGQLVDSATGEVIEDTNEVRDLVLENRSDPIMDLISRSGSVPIHVAKARELKIPAPTVSTYIGNPPDSANAHLNKRIELIGAIVYFSGAFTPKDPSLHDGSGFYTFLVKTMESKKLEYRVGREVKEMKIPTIIKCDGVKIRETMIGLIETYGWYDWKDQDGNPVKVPAVFTRGGENNSFFLTILPE